VIRVGREKEHAELGVECSGGDGGGEPSAESRCIGRPREDRASQRGRTIGVRTESTTGVLLNTAPPWRGHDIRSSRPLGATNEPGYFVVTPSKNRSITKSVSTISFIITSHHPKSTTALYHRFAQKSMVRSAQFGESRAWRSNGELSFAGPPFSGT